jgi:hypothetical protein
MKKILCICTNKQGVENIQPIVKAVKNLVEAEVIYLNMDGIYHQDCYSLLKNEKILDLGIKLNSPLLLMNNIKKMWTIYYCIKNIKIEEEFNYLIISGIGIIEYYLLKRMKNNYKNLKVYFIQDSILLYPEKYILMKKLRKIFYGFREKDNVCDYIFVSGELTKETKIIDGVERNKIIVSGNPRFSPLFVSQKQEIESRKIQFLFLTGAFSWHGQNDLENNERSILKEINMLAGRHKETININIKVHPRTYDISFYNELNNINHIYNNRSEDTYSIIKQNHIIISAQLPSTLLFESFWLGKMCIFYENKNKYIMGDVNKFRQNVFTVKSIEELEKIIKSIIKNDYDDKLYCLDKEYFISSCSVAAENIIAKKITAVA